MSYRDVEDLLAERGLDLSYETVRRWVLKFGPGIARRLRRRRPRPSDRWHLDEMVVRIPGRQMYLWRAADAIVTKGLPLGNDGKELTAQIIAFGPVIPKGAKNVPAAREFLKYAVQPKVLNEYLKGGLGRWMLPIPELVKSDPFWMKENPHREAYAKLTLLAPTMPIYEVYNPGIAQVNSEHLFSVAMFDIMNEGMAPEKAVDKAFKRAEQIFAKYPIAQG